MTDTVKFREAVAEKGLKYKYIAEKLNMTRQSLQQKIENDSEFKASEIKALQELLELSVTERDAIFFAK